MNGRKMIDRPAKWGCILAEQKGNSLSALQKVVAITGPIVAKRFYSTFSYAMTMSTGQVDSNKLRKACLPITAADV